MSKVNKLIAVAICSMALSSTTFAATNIPVKVVVNGATIDLKNEPIIKDNGYIYIEIEDIATALGFEIKWYPESQLVNLKSDKLIIGIQANNKQYSKKRADGKLSTYKFADESIPIMVDGKMYVPTGDFISVVEGRVGWDDKNKSYTIMHDWSLNYSKDKEVTIYAGTGQKGSTIGETAKDSQFIYAQNIHTTEDNTTYVVDAGSIRLVKDGKLFTYDNQPENIKISTVKGKKNEVYGLSVPAKDSLYYGIYKIQENGFEKVYTGNVKDSKVLDFEIVNTDIICLLKQEIESGQKYLELVSHSLKFKTYKVPTTEETTCIAADNNYVYLGKSDGTIGRYEIKTRTISDFAGEANVNKLKDGDDPLFCFPRKMEYYKGSLYILDFNMIRKLTINNDDSMGACSTVAGKVTGMNNAKMSSGDDEELIISATNPIDLSVGKDGVLVTDATQFKIMKID